MERFIKREDCWLDTQTGLEWELSQSKEKFNYENAIKYCESLGADWRLPIRPELESVLNLEKYDPATDLPDTVSSGYWSATTDAFNTDYAWDVYFRSGYVFDYGKSNALYVRAVRGGGEKWIKN